MRRSPRGDHTRQRGEIALEVSGQTGTVRVAGQRIQRQRHLERQHALRIEPDVRLLYLR